MNKYLLIGLGLVGILIGLKIYQMKKLYKDNENELRIFLASDKYKVKGQYDWSVYKIKFFNFENEIYFTWWCLS